MLPITCLATADAAKHEGPKPIAIMWKLLREMPVNVFTSADAVARRKTGGNFDDSED